MQLRFKQEKIMTGSELKQARLNAKLTQVKLAELVGYTERQVRKWETDEVAIPARTEAMLKRVLK